ncbi:hypothetical protein [Arthrobacter sp. ES3-54]|uniref:hypothetical protein n=1 Tax=Arthrobacter sp. ES3-54 TaxID=1502991 RepID=UPI002404A716|nr:hypothetical protein [Arthrobacter sp. ES3-54]MDF9752796.1 hypothetical protein [Arthrobacter sp. ES3-54]
MDSLLNGGRGSGAFAHRIQHHEIVDDVVIACAGGPDACFDVNYMTRRTTGPRYKYPNECVTNDVVTHQQEAIGVVIQKAFRVRRPASSIQ